MRRTGWPKATFRPLTLASASTTSPCRPLPAAGRLTASHGMRSGRWRAASRRDALLLQLLGSVRLAECASGQNDTCGPCPGGRPFRKMIRDDTGGPVVAKQNKKEKEPRTPARFAPGGQVRVKPG